MWLYRVLSSIVFLFSIIISIPLAFDVGGRTCGLAFSLFLSTFYFFYSILRIVTPPRGSRFRWALTHIIALTQWFLIPTLLIICLNRFSVDADNSGGWVERTFESKVGGRASVKDRVFGPGGALEQVTVGGWDKMLHWSTPVFQLAEGFCSLLVIQAAGQISRWLANSEKSDSWMIGMLVMSASVISSSVYFLWRITRFPEIGNVDASLIGVTITCAFAYIVLCMYQIFTDYLPSEPAASQQPPVQPDFPPFPPIVMASYTTLLHALSTLPSIIHSAFTFLSAALSTITPSVIISLAYRLFVLYASTRIIPAVRESGARALSQEASLEDSDGAGRLLGLLSWFSPSILIAVYTSLLMQHFASTSADGQGAEWWTTQGGDTGGNVWRWINVGGTMALYALELYLGKEDYDGGLTEHWKAD
ncbi:MAG: RuvB ATP-dependent DNA helicase pontin [Chaenotheca gracillima]|nr:MAG: RuvB ATP-dependent DNA helicase pontin [Chaenotheca gracillima]